MQKAFCRIGLIVVLAARLAAAPALSWAAGGKLVLAKDRDPEVYDPQRTTAISAGAVSLSSENVTAN